MLATAPARVIGITTVRGASSTQEQQQHQTKQEKQSFFLDDNRTCFRK